MPVVAVILGRTPLLELPGVPVIRRPGPGCAVRLGSSFPYNVLVLVVAQAAFMPVPP